MKNKKEHIFPNPEGKINVLKGYLHILALMQHIPQNGETWNATKLADILIENPPLEIKNLRRESNC